MDKLFKAWNYMRLQHEYSALETKCDVLEKYIKDKSLERVLLTLGEPEKVARLQKENRRLRKQNKELKELAKRGAK